MRVKKILRTWIMNGAFEVVTDRDKKGNERKFVVVGEWAAE